VDKYNVSVKTSSISASEEILTTLKAGGTSRFSLCTPATAIGTQLAPAGLLQPLDVERLPNTKQYIPRIIQASKHFEVDGKVYVTPYVWGLSACVYDSKVLPKGPQSWDEFKSPKYAKRLAMLDSTLDNFATWAPPLGYSEPFNLTTEELEAVTAFLIEFKSTQVKTFTSNLDDAADQLARGEIDAIGTMAWIYLVTLTQEKGGKSVTWNLPKGVGGSIWVDGWAIPSEAPNVDTAYAFADYMIGEQPQLIVAPATYSETVNSKAATQMPHSERPTEKYSNAVLEERAVLFETPTGENGKASYEDYVRAWARVQAA
jgi:spermidine/putrescine-binding protein